MSLQQLVMDTFEEEYAEVPTLVVRAPGRVNLIGEHTDYNDGYVMPLAIDRVVWIALRPTNDSRVSIKSLDLKRTLAFDLDNFEKGRRSPIEYLKGVVWALQEAGHHLKGFEGVMSGDVPIGAGLSSSAALELAVMCALASVSALEWDAKQMALLAQKAENHWVGVSSGIMDQMISATGLAGHVLLIDCRSLDTESLSLPDDVAVVVLDTSTRRGLAGSAYNERRAQCEAAAAYFGVAVLREVSSKTFEAEKAGLDDVAMRRAKHVIYENERVLQARAAIQAGDMDALGQILNAGHISLRDDFEVSSDALNAIVEAAQSHSACYGARMTGAGFGGCAVALVKTDQTDDFVQHVTQRYTQRTPHTPAVYVTRPTQGAQVVVDNR